MKKLKAGYAVEAIINLEKQNNASDNKTSLLPLLCEFEIITNQTNTQFSNPVSPIYSIAQNMIQRGSPTPASVFMEQTLASLFAYTQAPAANSTRLDFRLTEEGNKHADTILKALHTVDPRISPPDVSDTFDIRLHETSGGFQENFLFSFVPAYLGKHIYQYIHYKVDFLSLLQPNFRLQQEFLDKLTPGTREAALQPVGFVLRTPGTNPKQKGFIVEIEENSANQTQKKIDSLRDSCAEVNGWKTIRIPVYQFNQIKEIMEPMRKETSSGFYAEVRKNFDEPLYQNESGLHAMELSLSPMLAARIQLAILELVKAKKLDTTADVWRFAFLEQDIPAAWLAVEDFTQLMSALFRLEGRKNRLPEILIFPFGTNEFKNAKLNAEYGNRRKDIQYFKPTVQYDAVFDVSILQQKEITGINIPETSCPYVVIRNALHLFTDTSVAVDNSARLKEFTEKRKEKRGEYLLHLDAFDYFLQNIFRFKKLNEIQYQILEPMLQNRNTLISVAAGTGKSTVSHLSGFFQPGLTLLVEPDAYAAYEHKKRFEENNIDSFHIVTEFESTSRQWEETADILLQHTPQFCVLSAEVMRDKAFADLLLSSGFYKKIRQIIIDEAHVVSEWSDDFKPWLTGIRKFFEDVPSEWGVSLLAITELQTEMVIADICQEFDINRGDCIEIGEPLANRFKYKFIETEYIPQNDPAQDEFLYNTRKQVAVLKQTDLIQKQNDKFKILLTSPFANSNTGVYDSVGDGIGNKLKLRSSGLKAAVFQKNLPDATWVNPVNIEQNKQSIQDFETGTADTLVANYEVTYASSFDKVTDIIQLVMPQSPETFAQILNTTAPGVQANVLMLGNTKSGLEKTFAHRILYKHFKSKNHLQNVLNEILNEIYPPEISWKEKIEYALSINIGVEVFVKVKDGEEYLLEIYNLRNERLGALDERNWKVNVSEAKYLKLLRRAAELIKSWLPEDDYINRWLNRKATVDKTNGVLRIALRTNVPRTIFIPAINRSVTDIIRWANQAFVKKPVLSEFFDTWNQSLSAFEWMQRLRNLGKLSIEIPANDIPEAIVANFEKYRNTAQTANILSKLQALHIIEHFFYIPELDEFEVRLNPVSDNDVETRLVVYLSRYLSEGEAQRKVEEALSTEKSPVLQAADVLLNFVWDEMFEMGEEQISFMEKLYQITQEEQLKDKPNHERITKYINDSFHLRYANRDFEPNLLVDSNNTTKLSFDLVESYIKTTGGKRQLWKNLNQSANKLLNSNAQNYMIRMLGGYSGVLLAPRPDKNMYLAAQQLATAYHQYRTAKKTTTEEFITNVKKVNGEIDFHSPQNFDIAKPIIELNLHSNWLTSFNKKFLEGYERTN